MSFSLLTVFVKQRTIVLITTSNVRDILLMLSNFKNWKERTSQPTMSFFQPSKKQHNIIITWTRWWKPTLHLIQTMLTRDFSLDFLEWRSLTKKTHKDQIPLNFYYPCIIYLQELNLQQLHKYVKYFEKKYHNH